MSDDTRPDLPVSARVSWPKGPMTRWPLLVRLRFLANNNPYGSTDMTSAEIVELLNLTVKELRIHAELAQLLSITRRELLRLEDGRVSLARFNELLGQIGDIVDRLEEPKKFPVVLD